jgi:hypothetical protein
VSQSTTTSEVRAVIGELRRRQVMDIVRGATFVGTLLLSWITLRPLKVSPKSQKCCRWIRASAAAPEANS